MHKLRRQFARLLILASTFAPTISPVLAPTLLQAQSPTKQAFKLSLEKPAAAKGIDPAVLANANAGDATAQTKVGFAYEAGEVIWQDYALAAFWYRKAAEQGNATAQFNLGLLYAKGLGVVQDYSNAAFWYRKAAEQGYARSQSLLGDLYEGGYGVQQDYAQAAIWYRKAADQGDAWGQYRLGCMYQYGRGVPQSFAVSAYWDEMAAKNEDIGASLPEVQASLAEIRKGQREDRIRAIEVTIAGVLIAGLLVTFFRYRKELIRLSKRLAPRTIRAKQLAVLLPVATWCSACCLYEVLHPRLMIHPINAAVTALLLSTPALIFGAVVLWWLSQGKKTD